MSFDSSADVIERLCFCVACADVKVLARKGETSVNESSSWCVRTGKTGGRYTGNVHEQDRRGTTTEKLQGDWYSSSKQHCGTAAPGT